MKLKDMKIGEILARIEFTDALIEKYKKFCEGKPPLKGEFFGLKRSIPEDFIFVKMIPKDEPLVGVPVPTEENEDASE
jgi:hypothetical protein